MANIEKTHIRLQKLDQSLKKKARHAWKKHMPEKYMKIAVAMKAVENSEKEIWSADINQIAGLEPWRNTEYGYNILDRYGKALKRLKRVREPFSDEEIEEAEKLYSIAKKYGSMAGYGGSF